MGIEEICRKYSRKSMVMVGAVGIAIGAGIGSAAGFYFGKESGRADGHIEVLEYSQKAAIMHGELLKAAEDDFTRKYHEGAINYISEQAGHIERQ